MLTVVVEYLAYLLLGEAHHGIELRLHGVVGAYVEAAGQVVHRHGTYASDKQALDGASRPGFDGIEEGTKSSRAMGLRLVTKFCAGIGEDGVGEVVVLIDEEIHLSAGLIADAYQGGKLIGSPFLGSQNIKGIRWKQVFVVP